jgi:hypothetical protein
MTWEEAVAIGLKLPEVVVSTSYGTPALKVRDKLLTRLRPEDDSLVLLGVGFDLREAMLEQAPETFHLTPHYQAYPCVLARLSSLAPDVLFAHLDRRWREVAPKRLVRARTGEAGR